MEGRCKHKDNTRCVIEEKTKALGVKPLRRPPSGKQSKPIKITSTTKNKRQRLRERRCKHRDNTRCVIEEETETLGVKPLRRPPNGK